MVKERIGPEVNKPLTRAQEQVVVSVAQTLRNTDIRQVIIIKGLSGVGKTAVAQFIEDRAEQDATVVEPDEIRHASQDLLTGSKNLVTTTTLAMSENLQAIAERDFPDTTVTTVVLPAMDQYETEKYVATLLSAQETKLSPEQITEYSLGIPSLAQRLTTQGMTQEAAVVIVAQYLSAAFRYNSTPDSLETDTAPYINMPIPKQILEIAQYLVEDSRIGVLYEGLMRAQEVKKELEERGTQEESPLFVAPESEYIYNQMLRRTNATNVIEIFVPDMSIDDIDRVQEALGYDPPFLGYGSGTETRAAMFNATFRKAGVWHMDETKYEAVTQNEVDDMQGRGRSYLEAYLGGRLNIDPRPDEYLISVLVHKHEHEDTGVRDVANFGWMMESMLQQRGVGYFVNNHRYGASYIYDPETKHIRHLQDLKDVRS